MCSRTFKLEASYSQAVLAHLHLEKWPDGLLDETMSCLPEQLAHHSGSSLRVASPPKRGPLGAYKPQVDHEGEQNHRVFPGHPLGDSVGVASRSRH